MKYFFWLSGLAYVFVYFYAAWIYEEFSMSLAIVIFILTAGFVYWRYKRHITKQTDNRQPTYQAQFERQPLSLWRSPVPYVGFAVLMFLFIVIQLI